MPRELVWTGFITVDGKVDSPGGTAEGHAGGGWVMQTDFVREAFALKDEELTETFSADVRQAQLRGLRTGLSGSPDHAAYQELHKFVVSSRMAAEDLAGESGHITVLRSPRTSRRSSSRTAAPSSSTAAPSSHAGWAKQV